MNDLVKKGNGALVSWEDFPEFSLDAVAEIFTDGIRSGVDTLSIRGGKWRVTREGVATLAVDAEGNASPIFKGVILSAAPGVQRTYYEGKYDPESSEQPTCSSNDGRVPEAHIVEPQHKSCAGCPMAVWGSAVSEISGKGIPACRENKKLAVVDALAPDTGPMLLRVPRTALNEMDAYFKGLAARGKAPGMVITGLGFDPETSYPKPTFKVTAALKPEDMPVYVQHIADGSVARVLGLDGAAQAAPVADPKPAAKPASKKKASKKKVVSKKPKEAPVLSDEDTAAIEAVGAPVLEGASEGELDVLKELGPFAGLETPE